ncbi:hypothetical protein BRADI_4g28711v3 [Brachypodium distachyon]|uniref:Uncharacterized protein n=1 Tax=Brachypodium distachyon TaxID=15368 RepID=A0A0Q3LBU4_BRADI|nr:hypothetical protein BRADI_4g28711v3 [Brachypodium distachyon]
MELIPRGPTHFSLSLPISSAFSVLPRSHLSQNGLVLISLSRPEQQQAWTRGATAESRRCRAGADDDAVGRVRGGEGEPCPSRSGGNGGGEEEMSRRRGAKPWGTTQPPVLLSSEI